MGTFVHNDSNGGNVTAITGVTWGTAGAAATNGDIAIIPWVFLNTETPTDPTSETWDLVVSNVSQDCEGRILKHDCDGTESGDITGWSTTGAGNRQAAVLYVARGYDFISGFKVFNETTNSTTHDCPTLTTADGYAGNFPADGDTTLVFVFDRAASTTASPPSGWATRSVSVFAATGTGGTIVGMADDTLTDSATFPVNPGAWSGLVSSDDAFTVTLSLRPTSSGTTHEATGDLASSATLTGASLAEKLAAGVASAAAALLGAASAVKSTLGDLAASVITEGAAAMAKASGGDVASMVTLAGTADVGQVHSAAGDRASTASLSGEALATHPAAGDQVATVALLGSGVSERVAFGDESVAVTLNGAALAERMATGDLEASAAMAGASLLTIPALGTAAATALLLGEADVVGDFDAAGETRASIRSAETTATAHPAGTASVRSNPATASIRSPG